MTVHSSTATTQTSIHGSPGTFADDAITRITRIARTLALGALSLLLPFAAHAQDAAETVGFGIRENRGMTLIVFVVFTLVMIIFINVARGGRDLFIRRIAGLNAIDEAIGRSTEMGRKVLYIAGIGGIDEIQTIASISILKHVALETAKYNTPFENPHRDPLTYTSARETVKEAFLEAGRPDLFNDEMVNYLTYDQFAFTAAVSGKMVREKPAVNFLIGQFFAESLLLAEAGQGCGAIQISGTAEVAQLPFFVCATDYTLIGEELYAASAYLGREPVMLGSIKGQDVFKLMLIVYLIVGVLLASIFGSTWMAEFMRRGG
jgi:hypothetical protein